MTRSSTRGFPTVASYPPTPHHGKMRLLSRQYDVSRPFSPVLSLLSLFSLRALLLALLSLLLAAPVAATAQRADLERIIHRQLLANGLEVIVLENHGVPLATIEFDVRNGAFTQTPEYEGLAHMYEHMFFKANREFPEPDQFAIRASGLGAIFNGTTSEERVNYYMTLPADSLAGGLHLMAAAIRWPLFRRDEIEREREVVLGEYDRAESNPVFHLTRAMDAKLWHGATSRKNVIGDRQVIRTTTPEKLREIQRRYYVPNNTALIVTGAVIPDSVFALAQRFLGDWPRGADPFEAYPIPPMERLAQSAAVIVEQPIGVALVLRQWHGPSVGEDPEATYVADVFSDLMNQSGSRLSRRLVDSGLFQSLTVNYYTLNHIGPISIIGQTTPELLRPALAALDAEIARFADPDYFVQDELEAVKAHRIVSSAFGRERASGFAQTLGFWWSAASLEYYMWYVDNMARQTRSELQAYAQRYIVGKPSVTGVLVPMGTQRAMELTEMDLLPRTEAR